jgi:hypothetical protein
MLDWFTGLIGYSGDKLSGQLNQICEISASTKETLWRKERPLDIEGSYSSQIQLKTASPTDAMFKASLKHGLECSDVCLWFSGNPSKFIQGHNVFGPSVSSLGPVLQETIRRLPASVKPFDADDKAWPAIHRRVVDMNTMIDMGSHQDVHDYLRFLEHNTRSRSGRPMITGNTVYWGKHSKRWAIKAYCKKCELEKHPPAHVTMKYWLDMFCDHQLRIELRLKTLEMENRGTLDESLIWEYFGRIGVSAMKANVTMDNIDLPRVVRLTLADWMAGVDVTHSLTKPTFYRHRQAILKATGLDISLPCAEQSAQIKKVDVSMDFLKSHEVKEIPSFFVNQGWLFQPGKSPVWDKS